MANQCYDVAFKLLKQVMANNVKCTCPTKSFQQGLSSDTSDSSDSDEDDDFKDNPYYTAYAKLLLEFRTEYAAVYLAALRRLNLIRRNIDSITVEVIDAIDDVGNQPHGEPKRATSQTVLVKPKRLNDIMSIDLLIGKSWKDISVIWFDYFITHSETFVALIPFMEFKDFFRKSINYPMFILQLSRENSQDGIGEFIFTQFECFDDYTVSNCTVRLTPVNSYKTHEENAPVCMTVEYFVDLCKSKKFSNKRHSNEESFVLMRATYNKKLLSLTEAKCLMNTLDSFYYNFCELKEIAKLLRLFNKGVKSFKH